VSGAKQIANGKTIKIKDDADLGIAILITEFGGGSYQPVATVVSINEAREIAASNMCALANELEHGGEPACPERYVVGAQGARGCYHQSNMLSPSPARHRRACGREVPPFPKAAE